MAGKCTEPLNVLILDRIGSKCHESSVAVTEFYSINLPRTEVLTAYCLPRKFIGSNCHGGSQGNWAYQSATYGIPHRPIDCTEFPTKCSRLSADN